MTALIALEAVELVPVIELEPGTFATQQRPLPAATSRDVPGEWHRYWQESLADSGVVGLVPLRPASWQVSTRQLTSPATLGRILAAIVRHWGGPEALAALDCKSVRSGGRALRWHGEVPVLSGGLALCCGGEVLIQPTCCGDLGNVSEWREAAAYRGPDWEVIWIGHPWVSVRFEEGRLVFSGPHESDAPTSRWAVMPEELGRAVAAAETELEDFVRRLLPALSELGVRDAGLASRKLAGLAD